MDAQTKGYLRVQDSRLTLFLTIKSKVGTPISTLRIVKITDTTNKDVLYQHPSYSHGEWQVGRLPNGRYTAERNGLPHATFTYQEQALGYVKFITGKQDNATPVRVIEYNPRALIRALKRAR